MGKDEPISVRIADCIMKDINAQDIFNCGVAHDINNNLATIIGAVDFLLSQIDGQRVSEIGDGLREILTAALKLQDIVRGIPGSQQV